MIDFRSFRLHHSDQIGQLHAHDQHLTQSDSKLQDLTQAVEYSQQATDLTPTNSPDLPLRLHNLSCNLVQQYEGKGSPQDLSRAIECSQRAVDTAPLDHPDRAMFLSSLGNRFSTRFEREGKSQDLIWAIENCQQAVDLTPIHDPMRAGYLHNLSNRLSTRYDQEGSLNDLTSAIQYSQIAVDLTPSNKLDRAMYLSNLSNCLSTRYSKKSQASDLIRAIDCIREAVELTSLGTRNRGSYLNNLSNRLTERYSMEGRPQDLIQAIQYSQEAIDLTPAGDSKRPLYLTNLSECLRQRYNTEGQLLDLTQALEYSRKAIDLGTFDYINRHCYLLNLSSNLYALYQREGRVHDLTEAILYGQEALNIASVGNSGQAACLNNLSNYLCRLSMREDSSQNLTRAVEYSERAANMTHSDDRNRAIYINALGNRLRTLYESEHRPQDHSRAVECSREALRLTPIGASNRASYLHNLSIDLGTQYMREKKLEDIVEAIKVSKEALSTTLMSSPSRAMYLYTLSIHLKLCYEKEGKLQDFTQAVDFSQQAGRCIDSPPYWRLRGYRNAIDLSVRRGMWQQARDILNCSLQILPLLISNLSSKFDQENMMKSVSGLAAVGCAIVLQHDNNGREAIRILELVRGTINRLTLNSRTNLSVLYEKHPDLATRFEDLRYLINTPTISQERVDDIGSSKKSIADRLERLIAKIGWEYFTSVPSFDKLLDVSSVQTAVFVNTTNFRTYSLLVHGSGRVQIMPLDQSIFQAAQYYDSRLRSRFGFDGRSRWDEANQEMRAFLMWMWDQIVGPVLTGFDFKPLEILSVGNLPPELVEKTSSVRGKPLEITGPSDMNDQVVFQEAMNQLLDLISRQELADSAEDQSSGHLGISFTHFPRIHWLGSGCLNSFPFHAAGHGSDDSDKNTMSCVISSYASTLSTRAYAKQKPVKFGRESSPLLIVATPDKHSLPFVEEEIKVIKDEVENLIDVRSLICPSVKTVLEELPHYRLVHFACDGEADPQSPFRSGLLLRGNQSETITSAKTQNSVLTVETIGQINTTRSQLAYLSACSTAQNKFTALLDEGIHLASGFQLAGYPHVIASLWEAHDWLAMTVAKRFYQVLLDGSPVHEHEKAAYALHDAILAARRVWDDPLAWAPFVHLGP